MTQRITWLASYARSGNTWLRFLLHCYYVGRPGSSAEVAAFVPDLHVPGQVEARLAKPDGDAPLFAKTHFVQLLIWGLWWPGMVWAAVVLASSLMFGVLSRAATPDAVLIFWQTAAICVFVLATFRPHPTTGEGPESPQPWQAGHYFPKSHAAWR